VAACHFWSSDATNSVIGRARSPAAVLDCVTVITAFFKVNVCPLESKSFDSNAHDQAAPGGARLEALEKLTRRVTAPLRRS
jgi:hypothetical protein